MMQPITLSQQVFPALVFRSRVSSWLIHFEVVSAFLFSGEKADTLSGLRCVWHKKQLSLTLKHELGARVMTHITTRPPKIHVECYNHTVNFRDHKGSHRDHTGSHGITRAITCVTAHTSEIRMPGMLWATYLGICFSFLKFFTQIMEVCNRETLFGVRTSNKEICDVIATTSSQFIQ
jgi:hypothetical protein